MTEEDNDLKKIKQLIESNARAIEALSEDRKKTQAQIYRAFELLASILEREAQMYRGISNLDERQAQLTDNQREIIKILNRLVP